MVYLVRNGKPSSGGVDFVQNVMKPPTYELQYRTKDTIGGVIQVSAINLSASASEKWKQLEALLQETLKDPDAMLTDWDWVD